MCIWRRGILVPTVRRIERDTSDYVPGLQPDPSINSKIFQHGFSDENLPRTSRPCPISSVPRVLAEAEVDAVALDWEVGHLVIPFVTPSISVVMTREESHEPRSGSDSLHEWDVLSAVLAGGIIGAVGAPALRLLGQWVVIVDAGLAIRVDTCFSLQGEGGVRRYVHECKRRDGLAMSLVQLGVRLLEPVDYACVDPVRLSDLVAICIFLLEEKATSAIEEPEQQRRGARVVGCTITPVHWKVVVRDASVLVKDHFGSPGI